MSHQESSKSYFRFLGIIFCVAGLLAAGWALYRPLVHYDFVNWDDDLYVYRNPSIRGLTWQNAVQWFTRPYVALYVPIPMLSYALDYQWYGLAPGGYHLTSVWLHLVNTLLVFGLFRVLKAPAGLSFLGALIFCVHPVQVESVAWISQRKNLLCALFLLAGFLLGIKGYESKYKGPLLSGALFCFLLSILSKPTAIMIPFVILFFDYCYRGGRARQGLAVALFLILPAAVLGLFTLSLYPEAIRGFDWSRILNHISDQFLRLLIYFKLAVYPKSLDLFYPDTWAGLSPFLWGRTLWAVLGLAMIISFFYLAWRRKETAFWPAWFFLFLIPVANLLPVAIADRHLYVPLVGLIGFLLFFFRRCGVWLAIALSVALVFCVPAASARIGVWENSKTLWESVRYVHARRVSIGIQLAGYYEDRQELEKAAAIYWDLIRRRPSIPYPYINLYNLYVLQGHEEQANAVAEAFRVHYSEAHELPAVYQKLVELKPHPKRVEELVREVRKKSRFGLPAVDKE